MVEKPDYPPSCRCFGTDGAAHHASKRGVGFGVTRIKSVTVPYVRLPNKRFLSGYYFFDLTLIM